MLASIVVTVKIGLLSGKLGYDSNTSAPGFNFSGEGSLPTVIQALKEFGDRFSEYRGPEFQEFYSTLKYVIKQKYSPDLIPTIKIIKKKYEGELFVESNECYKECLEKRYGLPVVDVVTKENRSAILARSLDEGGFLAFKKNRLGMNVPLLYVINSDLSLHQVKLRTQSVDEQKMLCNRVMGYRAFKEWIETISPHFPMGLRLGIPTPDHGEGVDKPIVIHPFLNYEFQNRLSLFPEPYIKVFKQVLNYNINHTLPILIDLINSTQETIILQKHGSNTPGFYLLFEEGEFCLTRGDKRWLVNRGFPDMIMEIQNIILRHRISKAETFRSRFADCAEYRDKLISFDCGRDGNIILKYPNFHQQTITEVLDDVPSREYVDSRLSGYRARKFLEDYQKQENAIPFKIDFIEQLPLNQFHQLIVNYNEGYVSIGYLTQGYEEHVFQVSVQVFLEHFSRTLRSAYEEMGDNHFCFTSKFHKTHASSQSKGIPEIVPDCEPENLLRMFQEINFSDPSGEDYLDPKTLTKEGKQTTVEVLASSLIFFVSRLNIDRHIEWDAVPHDPEEQKKFKLNLRAYLSHIIFALKNEPNRHLRNDMVYQIAESGDLCGRRWQNVVQQIYRQVVLQTTATSDNVEEFFLECADQMKLAILDDMLMKSSNNQNVHERPLFMKLLSANGISLPGLEAFESDDRIICKLLKARTKTSMMS